MWSRLYMSFPYERSMEEIYTLELLRAYKAHHARL